MKSGHGYDFHYKILLDTTTPLLHFSFFPIAITFKFCIDKIKFQLIHFHDFYCYAITQLRLAMYNILLHVLKFNV